MIDCFLQVNVLFLFENTTLFRVHYLSHISNLMSHKPLTKFIVFPNPQFNEKAGTLKTTAL